MPVKFYAFNKKKENGKIKDPTQRLGFLCFLPILILT